MMLTVNCLTGKATIISPWSTTVTASRDRRCPPDPQVSSVFRSNFADLHFVLQICIRFSRFAFRFANLRDQRRFKIAYPAMGIPIWRWEFLGYVGDHFDRARCN